MEGTWRGSGAACGPRPCRHPGPGAERNRGTRHELPAPEALGDSVALVQVVDPQETPCIGLAVGLGPFLAELLVGVATVPLRNVGRLGPYAHDGSSPVLRGAQLPFVLDVGHTPVPEGLF